MSVANETAFSLNGVTSNFCMKLSGAKTVAVLGLIKVRASSNRDSPPACGNGFETDYLAFAKGHVIALELGGSDHRNNVVPQFEHWQGKPNGAWRQMEIELKDHAGKIMLVEIGYGRTGGEQSFETLRTSFEDNRLIDWTDERIPDSFTVSVWPAGTLDPSTITTDIAFDAAVVELRKTGTSVKKPFVLGNAMPEPDRSMYIDQEAITIAMDLFENRPEGLQRTLSEMTWLLQETPIQEIRTQLLAVPNVTPTEATGFQFGGLLFAMHDTTPAKAKKKHKLGKAKGLAMIDEVHIEKKRKF